MHLIPSFAASLLASLVLIGSLISATPAYAAFAGANGKIVYSGPLGIMTVNPDGTGPARIPYDPGIVVEPYSPAWSSNGTRIAWMQAGNFFDVWAMNADGSNPRNVTNQTGDDGLPSWSPDGTFLAYEDHPRSSPILSDVWTINIDGTGSRNLTRSPNVSDTDPAWSPDGTRIAFATNRDGNWEVYVMNADGTGQTRLTDNPASDGFSDAGDGYGLAWSPDSSQIAFVSDRDGNWEIYSMNADGTGQTRLTDDPSVDNYPVWSPDGKSLLFDTNRTGNYDVFSMRSDGREVAQVTHDPSDEYSPDWQPLPSADAAMTVDDAGFAPSNVTLHPGDTLQWNFSGTLDHSVSSPRWLAPAGSGLEPPGGAYSATFTAAGGYLVEDGTDGARAQIGVPLVESPRSGGETTTFTILWSTATAGAGLVFDVQIARPGDTSFQDWLTSQTAGFTTFVPDGGVGAYYFRARVRRVATNQVTPYSPKSGIVVA